MRESEKSAWREENDVDGKSDVRMDGMSEVFARSESGDSDRVGRVESEDVKGKKEAHLIARSCERQGRNTSHISHRVIINDQKPFNPDRRGARRPLEEEEGAEGPGAGSPLLARRSWTRRLSS